MSSDWQIVKLKDIADLKGGNAFKSGEYSTEGVFVLRTVNINEDGSITEDGAKYVSDETAAQYKRFNLQEWDTLFVMVGATLGKTGLVRGYDLPALLNQNMWVIRATSDQVNPRYLHYAFSEESKALLGFASGAARDFVRRDDFRNMELRVPPKETQDQISSFVGTIDDKVRLNHKINETLEQIAQAIFKSWFVDFEPVKAKIAARQRWHALQPVAEPASPVCYAEDDVSLPDLETYMNLAAMQAISGKGEEQLAQMQVEQPKEYGELLATAGLFPSAMQESELGEVPEGWSPVRVESYFDLFYGKALKKTDRVDGQYPVYGSGGITGSHNTALVSGPGIIVGRKGTVGSIYWEDRDFYPIDTAYYVSAKENYSLLFVYYLLQNLGLENMNTDAAVPGLNRNNVYRLEVPHFPLAIIERFDRLARCFSTEVAALRYETEVLTSLRDALLPKLLSGELTLHHAVESQTELREEAYV